MLRPDPKTMEQRQIPRDKHTVPLCYFAPLSACWSIWDGCARRAACHTALSVRWQATDSDTENWHRLPGPTHSLIAASGARAPRCLRDARWTLAYFTASSASSTLVHGKWLRAAALISNWRASTCFSRVALHEFPVALAFWTTCHILIEILPRLNGIYL